jgi:hypothetical protein
MKNNKNCNVQPRLFVGFIINDETGEYCVYLINNSAINYKRVRALTGAYCSIDDDLLETSKSVSEKGPLAAGSKVLIEKSDIDGLDFVIWFHFDLFPEKGKIKKYWFQLPKYYQLQENDKVMMPVINQAGWIIKLIERDGELIDEEIKTLVMESVYHKSKKE